MDARRSWPAGDLSTAYAVYDEPFWRAGALGGHRDRGRVGRLHGRRRPGGRAAREVLAALDPR